MEVQIKLDLEVLKAKLCPGCKEIMEKYLKELAVAQLIADARPEDGK